MFFLSGCTMHYSDIFVIIHLNVNTPPKNRKKNAGKIVNNVEKDIEHNGIISLIY